MTLLSKRLITPGEFHAQCTAVKELLRNDLTGLVDSLTDFSVQAAAVDYSIETENQNLNKTLREWLDKINIEFNGQIPSGINPVAEEFFKERWKGSSLCAIRLGSWRKLNGIEVPMKVYVLDGSSIHAKAISEDDDLTLINWDYYITNRTDSDKYKLSKDVILTKGSGRWFDKYPVPYIIKRGVYHNWKIIEAIKNKETQILEEIIPYMLLIKKGSEALATNNIKTYSDKELTDTIADFQAMVTDLKDQHYLDKDIKAPIRATNFDEQLNHLIPDLRTIFEPTLFASAEKNILTGLGFIDVADSVSSSRRESILNPKAFVEEVKKGIVDFKQVLKEIVIKIKDRNVGNVKYMNSDFYILSSPVKAFIGDDFKVQIRSLYDRGCVSKQTAVELIGETDFKTEVYRRTKETDDGLDEKMYPPITQNQEGQPTDIPGKPLEKTENIPLDKQGVEKKNFNQASLDEIDSLKKDVLLQQKMLLEKLLKPKE